MEASSSQAGDAKSKSLSARKAVLQAKRSASQTVCDSAEANNETGSETQQDSSTGKTPVCDLPAHSQALRGFAHPKSDTGQSACGSETQTQVTTY